jgi:hypothetical protein
MPFISFRKLEHGKAVAITRGDARDVKEKKFVYVTNEDPPENPKIELDNHDVVKRLKGYRTAEKTKIFEMMYKSALEGIDPDDLETEDLKLRDIYGDAVESAKNTLHAPSGTKFEVMPAIPDHSKGATRECIFVTGCSGSGKSWWTRIYCENFNKIHKGKRPIYLISTLEKDETLDGAKCKIQRVSMDALCDDPIVLDSGDLDDSLVIFDDWDTVEDEKGKDGRKYATVLWKLMNDILTKGRHMSITVVIISHYNTCGVKGKLILTESSKFVIYPHGTSAKALDYLLNVHVGIKKDVVKSLGELGRWVCLQKTFPKYLVSEHVCKLI